jgi:hypothetical protein
MPKLLLMCFPNYTMIGVKLTNFHFVKLLGLLASHVCANILQHESTEESILLTKGMNPEALSFDLSIVALLLSELHLIYNWHLN